MSNEIKFNCTSCGACCKLVGISVQAAKTAVLRGDKSPAVQEIAAFPHFIRPDGSCEHLLPDNNCAIYENRPVACNVKSMFNRFYKHEKSRRQFYRENEEACEKLQAVIENRKNG